jgi:hypothetical protein
MKGKIILCALGILAGAVFFLLGLMFCIASSGQLQRLIVGVVLAVAGAGGVFFGLRGVLAQVALKPEKIREKIFRLAKMHHGKVAENVILAEAGQSDAASEVIEKMRNSGELQVSHQAGKTIILFPQFFLSQVMKKCAFCGNDYPVRDTIEKCPSCGADLSMETVAIDSAEEKYSMDDQG